MKKNITKSIKAKSKKTPKTKKDLVKRLKKLEKSTSYRPLGHLRSSFQKGDCLSVL
tara:strand:+ start:237587 stop:237754 length:168 start_codon:yes stop_codon:yes gene_type:complete